MKKQAGMLPILCAALFALTAAFTLTGLFAKPETKTASAAADAKHADFVAVSANADHSLVLDADGGLWAWGRNNRGQLGDGTTADKDAPVQITADGGNITEFKAVSAGGEHSLALDAGGNLWTWGANSNYQLGDKTNVDKNIPVQIKPDGGNVTEFKAVSAGQYHNFALDVNGGLWAWGLNVYGRLGDGTTVLKDAPVQITADGGKVTKFKAVSTSNYHSLAIDANGGLWAWGRNNYDQLGNGTKADSNIPVQIKADGGKVTEFKAVSAGGYHSLAIDANGGLWAWGRNENGQLGDGTATQRLFPVPVTADGGKVTEFKSVSAGYGHSLVLDAGGGLWAWGRNSHGELGDGTTVNKNISVQITADGGDVTEFKAVSASGSPHSLAIDAGGGLWAWGRNNNGQLGDGTATDRSIPIYIAGGHYYFVTVKNGAGGGKYAAGDIVTITADAAPAGKAFDKWTAAGGVTFADANSATTTFTMPNKAVTVTAAYKNTAAIQTDAEPKDAGKGKNGLGGGAIAGIVIGSVAAAAAIGFAVYWFAFRKKSVDV